MQNGVKIRCRSSTRYYLVRFLKQKCDLIFLRIAIFFTLCYDLMVNM